MTCPYCWTVRAVADWGETSRPCCSSHCADDYALACPVCGEAVGHVWLDGQSEFRATAAYVRVGATLRGGAHRQPAMSA